jgi:hypothetical protein
VRSGAAGVAGGTGACLQDNIGPQVCRWTGSCEESALQRRRSNNGGLPREGQRDLPAMTPKKKRLDNASR